MTQHALRRFVAASASAAMLAAGGAISIGASTASAQASTCAATSTEVREPTIALGPLKHKYTYEKTVLAPGDARVPAGGTVTYQTTVNSKEGLPLVYSVIDYPPAGFTPVKAWVTAPRASGTKRTEVEFASQDAGYRVANGSGWMLTSGKPLIVEMQYRVPDDVTPGQEITSGGTTVSGTLKIGAQLADLDACVTVRPKNPVESTAGSLDGAGLGSVNTASTGAFGSLTDPAGSISDIINGVELSKLLGS